MREFAIDLARRAGALLLEFHHASSVGQAFDIKSSPVDLVTAADVASDHLINDALGAAFPAHTVYSEESARGPLPAAEWLWVIDPLDGTTNFAHRAPFFGVNIALAHSGVMMLAVTYDPLAEQLYWAERGAGAWLRAGNGERPLRASRIDDLGRSLLATGFPSDRRTNPDNNLAEFSALERRSHGVRRQGSAALELAWVAAGIVEAFWHPRLKPWDAAAGCWWKRPVARSRSMAAGHGILTAQRWSPATASRACTRRSWRPSPPRGRPSTRRARPGHPAHDSGGVGHVH